MEYRSVFKDCIGMMWDLEQGRQKGYHVHLALFYAGREHQKGWYIADACIQIWRELTQGIWRELTQGIGGGFNCHDKAYLNRYRELGRLGIGMIHRDDEAEMQNCIRTLIYLSAPDKPDQYLRMRPKRMRVFSKGIQCG